MRDFSSEYIWEIWSGGTIFKDNSGIYRFLSRARAIEAKNDAQKSNPEAYFSIVTKERARDKVDKFVPLNVHYNLPKRVLR